MIIFFYLHRTVIYKKKNLTITKKKFPQNKSIKTKRRSFYRPPIVAFDLPYQQIPFDKADYCIRFSYTDGNKQVVNQNHNQIYDFILVKIIKINVLTYF